MQYYIITLYSSKSYGKSWGVLPNVGGPDPPTFQWLRAHALAYTLFRSVSIILCSAVIAKQCKRCNSYGKSVCPSVCHTLIPSRRIKIGSCGFHFEVAKALLSDTNNGWERHPFSRKICSQVTHPL